jgi:endogenous inhibitor of DNA gyrase (YacG/DUF329 family)
MTNVEYQSPCALCGQPVEIEGFTLQGPQGELKFCCAGCQSIYQLLYESETTPTINHPSQKEEERKK